MRSQLSCGNFNLAVTPKPVPLAFREALVAMVIEAVPSTKEFFFFVVRVPVLDKESEAKPTTASVLPPVQGLDMVEPRPQETGDSLPHWLSGPPTLPGIQWLLPERNHHRGPRERPHRWA